MEIARREWTEKHSADEASQSKGVWVELVWWASKSWLLKRPKVASSTALECFSSISRRKVERKTTLIKKKKALLREKAARTLGK